MPASRSEAAKEVLKRRAIRSSLIEWGRHKGFEAAPHHRLICNQIEDFLSSDDEVLLLFAPPGSAKSTWLSVLFPSYYLARFPRNSILAATHSVEFAQRWGRRVRNDIALDSNVLGIKLAADSQASDRWALTSGGVSRASVPILGLVTTSSAPAKMPTARPFGRSAGTGMWMTLARG